MPDSNDAGTADAGTQDVDAAITTGTADTGTPINATQPTGENPIADSQPDTDTTQTPTPPNAPVGKQAPTPATAGSATANQWESDDNPYRKRHTDTLSHAQRLFQEKQQSDRQLTEYQQRIADFESKAKAAAETARLNPWNKGHPKHAEFRGLQDRIAFSRKMLAQATPEQKASLHGLMTSQFSPEELKAVQDAEVDGENLFQEFKADPKGFIATNVQDAIKSAFAEYDAFQSARSQVQGIITDPGNAKLIEAYAPDMQRMMDPNVPARNKAFEYASMKAELEALKAQVGQQAEQVATAEARQSARSGRTTTSSKQHGEAQHPRDAQNAIANRLLKRGIKPGDSRYDGALADELLRAPSA